ncbi:MAG: FAD:protein FMN transferase [Thermoanaerobaculia bacterium]|nr:FAD:protein FMN transferase [Thermoanaerobaculia bacterium]
MLLPSLLLYLLAVPFQAEATAPALERRFLLMGTEARVALWSTRSRTDLLAVSERARAALVASEARLSTWTADSELARLNAAPRHQPVRLSPELAADLRAAFECRAATAGAFDPELGRLVAAWGLRTEGRWPSADEITTLAAEAGQPGLFLDSPAASARRRSDRTIEEGAWGKGAALDHAVAALGPGVLGEIDLGGQLRFTPGRAATVAVAHPHDREHLLLALNVVGGSVATSGNGERGLVVEGRRIGHLLDPRTGRPAPDFGSVTVWAPTALEADCLATGLFVLGPEAAIGFAARRPDLGVVVVEAPAGQPPRIRASAGWRGRLLPLDPSVTIEFAAAPERPVAPTDEGAETSATTAVGLDSPMNRGDRASTRPPLDSTGV